MGDPVPTLLDPGTRWFNDWKRRLAEAPVVVPRKMDLEIRPLVNVEEKATESRITPAEVKPRYRCKENEHILLCWDRGVIVINDSPPGAVG